MKNTKTIKILKIFIENPNEYIETDYIHKKINGNRASVKHICYYLFEFGLLKRKKGDTYYNQFIYKLNIKKNENK